MDALLLYTLRTGGCLAVFYLFFKLLLSRETFHRLNRIVVLAILALSCVLPCCVLTITREVAAAAEQPLDLGIEPLSGPAPASPAKAADSLPGGGQSAAAAIYLAGIAIMLLRTACSLASVRRLIRSGRQEPQEDGTVLVRVARSAGPFSWGRYIIVSEEDLQENGAAIRCHEAAHARLHHSADLLFCDLVGALQWFNPAFWLLRRDLRAIHEYEADEAVLESGADARAYQLLLIKKAVGERWYSVTNSFNHSNLKNRITMMIRRRSPRWAAAKALVLLPLVGAALGAFAETVYVVSDDEVSKDSPNLQIHGPETAVPAVALRDGMPSPKPAESPTAAVTGCPETARSITPKPERTAADSMAVRSNIPEEEMAEGAEATGESAPGRSMTMTQITTVAKSDGATTSRSEVRIRRGENGVGSVVRNLDSDTTTIHVLLDGKEIPVQAIKAVDPKKIQSITVLKDSAAVRFYDNRGAQGVILMTTKGAKNGGPRKGASQLIPIEGDRVHIDTEKSSGGSITTYEGHVTMKRIPDVAQFYLNGQPATRDEVAAIKAGKIRRMACYKGEAAVERYGEEARGGVLEIWTRR